MTRRLRQQAFDDFNPIELLQKVRMPKVAPKLAVGDALHTDIFLNSDNIADAAIFDFAQLRGTDLALLILLPRWSKLWRPKQTADVIRPKRRFLH